MYGVHEHVQIGFQSYIHVCMYQNFLCVQVHLCVYVYVMHIIMDDIHVHTCTCTCTVYITIFAK